MEVFIGALILSICNSLLFWNKDLGLSVILFAIPLVYITAKVLKEKIENRKALILSVPIILLSSTYFIFNNEIFKELNIIVIPILYIVMILDATSIKFEFKSIFSNVIKLILEPINHAGEVFAKIKAQIMKKLNIHKEIKEKRKNINILKSLFFTGLIVLIVLLLLVSADNEFASIFVDTISIIEKLSAPDLVIRIIYTLLLFIYISSFFINILSKVKEEEQEREEKKKESFTIHMILTALNIIYIIFCFIQIKSLILVENIKYSEYARQGFFQLMLVSLINLVVLLKATNKNLIEDEKQNKYKKVMCIIMIICTLIIIVSSFMRMTLYQQKYGETRLRLLVDFTLITEVILLIPTIIYVIKSKINLMKTYSIIIIVMYCIINFVNIDYIIAKKNIDRYKETGKIDMEYLTYRLDSKTIIKQYYRLREDFPTEVNRIINNTNKSFEYEDSSIQSFNLTKWKAKRFIKENN